MSGIHKMFDSIRNLHVAEQFLKNCSDKLAVFMRERSCKTVVQMSEECDHFMEAQRRSNLCPFREKLGDPTAQGECRYDKDSPKSPQTKCFLCDRVRHGASKCRSENCTPFVRLVKRWDILRLAVSAAGPCVMRQTY